jgi:DNA primase
LGLIDKFLDWSHQCLLDSEEAQAYLRGRGVSDEQWARHRIGFTGGDYDIDFQQDPNHSDVCLNKDTKHLRCDSCHYRSWSSTWEGDEGQFKEQHVGKRIRNSVVFPLTTYAGTYVGFQVRSIVEKSYDTFALGRRPEVYFFGTAAAMNSIWATREVTLVEGPPDHLVFERLVAPNVLALTTNAVSPMHLLFLRRFVKRVNLCTDLDAAGRDGVKRFLEQAGNEFDTRVIKYPKLTEKSKDVGDLWKQVGDVTFSRHFKHILGGS